MALDGLTVANVCHELRSRLQNARIARIAQPEADALLLTLKCNDRSQMRLLMSASASLPLIYEMEGNQASPATAPNFCMLLRKHIGNGRIVDITQPGLERVIRFEIEHYDEMGDLRRKFLILELMGKHSNLIFTDTDENCTIIDSIKHVGALMSSVREVLPGRPYFIPETQQKIDPLTCDFDTFAQTVFTKAMPLPKALYTSCTGISPLIANEICFRASLEDERSASSLTEAQQLHFYHTFELLMEDVKEGHFTPCMVLDEKGEPVDFAAVPLNLYQDLTVKLCDSMLRMLEEYYRMRNTVTRIRQKSSDLRRVVNSAVERTAHKLQLQEKQMKDTEKRDKYRINGELLHTYGNSVEPGAESVVVNNYYTGEDVKITLDPTLSAADNAKRFYDKYTKLKRTYEALTVQLEESRQELEQLESIQTFLDMALTEADLSQVRQELEESGYLNRKGPSAGNGRGKNRPGNQGKKGNLKKARQPLSIPYHYENPDGYQIYVGKNNLQNDELTFKFASGGDWWFHSKGCPGSHVVLKSQGVEIPDSAFEDAARLAAFYSKNRASGKVEIDYVQRKEVKKPNGAKPGFVVYYTNYSMVIDTDISKLKLIEG